jgi:hypothetical protein
MKEDLDEQSDENDNASSEEENEPGEKNGQSETIKENQKEKKKSDIESEDSDEEVAAVFRFFYCKTNSSCITITLSLSSNFSTCPGWTQVPRPQE